MRLLPKKTFFKTLGPGVVATTVLHQNGITNVTSVTYALSEAFNMKNGLNLKFGRKFKKVAD